MLCIKYVLVNLVLCVDLMETSGLHRTQRLQHTAVSDSGVSIVCRDKQLFYFIFLMFSKTKNVSNKTNILLKYMLYISLNFLTYLLFPVLADPCAAVT